MDWGVPTEDDLAEMGQADPPVSYLVGTPKRRLSKLETQLLGLPWHQARDGVEVKLLPQEQDRYVLARSRSRITKERSMRRRQLKRLWARLKPLARGLTPEPFSINLPPSRCISVECSSDSVPKR
jgi:hypothetical protein